MVSKCENLVYNTLTVCDFLNQGFVGIFFFFVIFYFLNSKIHLSSQLKVSTQNTWICHIWTLVGFCSPLKRCYYIFSRSYPQRYVSWIQRNVVVKRYILKTKFETNFVEATKAIYGSQVTSPRLRARGSGLGTVAGRMRPRGQEREAPGKVPSGGWKCQWTWSSSLTYTVCEPRYVRQVLKKYDLMETHLWGRPAEGCFFSILST